MTPRVLMAPSMLSADFSRLGREIAQVEKAGADWLHVDVMDGHFVPNLTVGPGVVRWLRKSTTLPLDVHLMIDHPERYIPAFADAGAWALTVHWEACRAGTASVLRLIKKFGCRAGLSIRPRTPIRRIAPFMKQLDLVLVMTVEPGFGGQSFMAPMLPKIKWARDAFDRLGKKSWVEVDGGIDRHTAKLVAQAGADVLVAGHAIFARKDRAAALRGIRRAALSVL
jgi:ribulose-phosphate 3-epimerase